MSASIRQSRLTRQTRHVVNHSQKNRQCPRSKRDFNNVFNNEISANLNKLYDGPFQRDIRENTAAHFTSASGFLIDDNFFGTVYMREAVHYLEPRGRQSKDLRIFGDGLKTLLHKSVLKFAQHESDVLIPDKHGKGAIPICVPRLLNIEKRLCHQPKK